METIGPRRPWRFHGTIRWLLGIAAAGGLWVFPGRAAEKAPDSASNWPQWRGPLGTGVAPNANPPLEWSENKHIRWKIALPGKGHSTPIIWGHHIFLTTAIPYGEPVKPRFVRPGAHDNLAMTHHHEFAVL